jgi:hypothetical protein
MAITLEGADEQDWHAYRQLGSPSKVREKIDDLTRDNGRYRDRHREDQTKITELEGKLPKDGAVVLTKEQAADFEAYTKLGKPAEVSSAISDGAQAKAQLAARVKRDHVHEAAKVLGWQPSLAERIRGIDEGSITFKDEEIEQNGKKVAARVPYLTPAGEKQTPVKLVDYVAKNDPDIVDLLPAGEPDRRRAGTTGGVTVAPQSHGGRPPREGKLTDEDVRKATESTAHYSL